MKKIAIITLFGNHNYGNRLQNYALQTILEEKGFNVESLKNNAITNIKCTKPIENIKNRFLFVMKRIKSNIRELKENKYRQTLFKRFTEENIKTSKKFITGYNAKKIEEKYDYFIVGSDQVWNHKYRGLNYIDMLGFAPAKKRISYAASLGTSSKITSSIEFRKEELSKFKAISVREDAGKFTIEELTKRKDIEVVIDPTMLLSSKEWDKVMKKPKQLGNEKYILNYFLGDIPKSYKDEINRIAEEKKYRIINLLDKNDPFYESGPAEFLYLEKNASLICTDSFHSCVFAIIYNVPFINFERKDNATNMNSRLETLLTKFELQTRKFCGEITEKLLKCDYSEVYKILEQEKKIANNFLNRALDKNEKKSCLKIQKINNCSGCTSCLNACPKQAIIMIENNEGFQYPIINKEKCSKCRLCEKVCPIINNKISNYEPIAYAAYNKDEETRKKSSSGGIFSLISEKIIQDNGIVYGALIDFKKKVRHVRIDNINNLDKLRGSKYVQSYLGNIFLDVRKDLTEGKKVLFTGTPCQIEGLKSFLQKEYENLYTQDIICHGVPSPKVFKKYLTEQKNSRFIIDKVEFRNKDNGWKKFNIKITFQNKKNYVKPFNKDIYMKLFLNNLCLRKSCYNCSFKKYNRNSDITLADLWGSDHIVPKMDNNNGLSLVIINSDKGKKIFENIEGKTEKIEINLMKALKYNSSMLNSVVMPKHRERFFNKLDAISLKKIDKKYNRKSKIAVILNKIKKKIKKSKDGEI